MARDKSDQERKGNLCSLSLDAVPDSASDLGKVTLALSTQRQSGK